MRRRTRKIVLAGFFIALGFILPLATAQIPAIGSKLLPMHLPVLIGGFICGGPVGLIIGFILPLFRSAIYTMPPMFPIAIAMAFELAVYGLATGVLYRILPKNKKNIYISLIGAMILGRITWGIASACLYSFMAKAFTIEMFIAMGFVNALPGIIIQIILVPVIVLALDKAGLIENE